MPVQHDELMCGVKSLRYDFDKKIGELLMDDGSCCDMSGCVGMFLRIDPAVIRIQTVSGKTKDTTYERKRNGEWDAIMAG